MTIPRVWVAGLGGILAFVALCYGALRGSADAWRLFLTLAPPLIVFIWWMVDRAALERRIRRLEVRSKIADERRVTTQTNLAEVEHRLRNIEGRVGEVEHLANPANITMGKLASHKTADGTGHILPGYADETIIVRLPVKAQ